MVAVHRRALRPGLVATPAFGGDCFTGSFAVHNAYRCADGNFLRDPCFADATRDDAVLCVRDPFSRGVVRLRVSGHVDRSGSAPRTLVWPCVLRAGSGAASSPAARPAPMPPADAPTTAARAARRSRGATRSAAAGPGGSGSRTPSCPDRNAWPQSRRLHRRRLSARSRRRRRQAHDGPPALRPRTTRCLRRRRTDARAAGGHRPSGTLARLVLRCDHAGGMPTLDARSPIESRWSAHPSRDHRRARAAPRQNEESAVGPIVGPNVAPLGRTGRI
jgi:hypothetical protein